MDTVLVSHRHLTKRSQNRAKQTNVHNDRYPAIGTTYFQQKATKFFQILHCNTHDYYLCSLLTADTSQRQFRGTDEHKFEPFNHKRVMDALGFHYKAVCDWNKTVQEKPNRSFW